MSEVEKIQAWIARKREEAEQRIHKSVVAFEEGLPQPEGSNVAPLCLQLHYAHQMLGALTIGKVNR